MKKLIYTLLFVFVSVVANGQAKYVFYFIGDGMGVNQVNGTEMYQAELQSGRIGVELLLFTQFPVATLVTTFSASSGVTDSGAGGTALASGEKTYNGAIGVNADKVTVQSIAEKAKKAGKKVGIATSVSIDHATPASFYAHQPNRNMYYEIALELPKANFDFYAGGGFLKPTTTFDKQEAPSIFPIFEAAGYTLARGYNDYKAKASTAQKMILMQEDGKKVDNVPFAIDRQADDLTLTQITESAIDFLTKGKNNKGFFLMVEGGNIDWAGHANDAAAVFDEVKDMDNAIRVAYEFYKKHPKETLIVVTADHETGGIVLGTGGGDLNLKALQYQKRSVIELSKRISDLRVKTKNKVTWEEMKAFLGEEMGFWKEVSIPWEQEKLLRDGYIDSFEKNEVKLDENMYSKNDPMAACAKKAMDAIAKVGWITEDHSAGYVPVFAIGAGSQLFGAKMDNTEIPGKIAQAAGYK